jgi:hypothetical protein
MGDTEKWKKKLIYINRLKTSSPMCLGTYMTEGISPGSPTPRGFCIRTTSSIFYSITVHKYSIFHFPSLPYPLLFTMIKMCGHLDATSTPTTLSLPTLKPSPDVIYRIFLLVVPYCGLTTRENTFSPPQLYISPGYILHSYHKRNMDSGGC